MAKTHLAAVAALLSLAACAREEAAPDEEVDVPAAAIAPPAETLPPMTPETSERAEPAPAADRD